MRASFVVAALVGAATAGAAGCDSRATAADPGRGADQKSREYETCAASVQCQDELRCFDHACRRTARSTVGDYFAAAGALAEARGDAEAAIADYAQALAHYDTEKLGLPPDVDCAYGAVLAAGRARKERAELAARVLHRCVLTAPVGSRLHDQALAALATLGEVGLDPALLGGGKLADLYLTRAPTKPATDRLAVTVTPSPAPSAKSYPMIPDKLGEADVKAALIACWDAYNAASHKEALSVTIGVKASYIPSEYEDEPGVYSVKLDPPLALPAGSPEAAADGCVRQIVEPAIKGLKLTDAFATKLAIAIK